MARNLKILSIDDDLINLKLINTMLKKSNKVDEIVEASNGLDALNILDQRDDIDMVLLDIKMPVMDGIEVLSTLKAKGLTDKIAIVVITTDETRKAQALDNGAYDFLTKPVRKEDIEKRIDQIYQLVNQ